MNEQNKTLPRKSKNQSRRPGPASGYIRRNSPSVGNRHYKKPELNHGLRSIKGAAGSDARTVHAKNRPLLAFSAEELRFLGYCLQVYVHENGDLLKSQAAAFLKRKIDHTGNFTAVTMPYEWEIMNNAVTFMYNEVSNKAPHSASTLEGILTKLEAWAPGKASQ